MLRKTVLILALSVSTISLSGCSTTWNKIEGFANNVYRTVVPLRGSSDKTETPVQMADADMAGTNMGEANMGEDVRFTEVGAYIADEPAIDTSLECPEGTYLTADNYCEALNNGTFTLETSTDVYELATTQSYNTSSGCPDGTYLTEDNACMFLETETFGLDSLPDTSAQISVDTFPTCPEGTYLTAENTCMYLQGESFETAETRPTPVVAMDVECPPGFAPNGSSCMYIGDSEASAGE